MKLKEGFVFRKIAGDNVVVPVGQQISKFNGLIKLNESGAFLWNILKEGSSKEELVDKLLEEYEIDRDFAENDVEKFINILKERDMLEV
ncbi:PqqD family protein [Intestinibacter bartlettii]|uniref:PqqD family protein n=1 Tax=Intestinibacter bartlettii TaxID=261299 RepID=UPI00319E9FB8